MIVVARLHNGQLIIGKQEEQAAVIKNCYIVNKIVDPRSGRTGFTYSEFLQGMAKRRGMVGTEECLDVAEANDVEQNEYRKATGKLVVTKKLPKEGSNAKT